MKWNMGLFTFITASLLAAFSLYARNYPSGEAILAEIEWDERKADMLDPDTLVTFGMTSPTNSVADPVAPPWVAHTRRHNPSAPSSASAAML